LNDAADIPDGLGGVPVNELADGLLSLGHRVSIYTCSPAVSDTVRLGGEHLDITVVPFRRSARARAFDFFRQERRGLERELSKSSFDVVHAHWTYEFALAAIKSGKSRKLPLLITAHDAPFTILRFMPDTYRLMRTAMAIRVRFALHEMTAVSSYLADRWRTQMFYRRPIPIIANIVPGLPPPTAPSSLRNRWVILDVANDSRLKNVRTLVHAFAKIVEKYPEAELRLVGPGLGAADATAEWARSCRLDTNITFVGSLDRSSIADEYARASIFCHSSLEEAQPLALLEALDAGLVVIGGESSGGVPWTLFGGRAGILVDVRSPSAIADGIFDALAKVNRGYCLDPGLVRAIEARHGRDAVTRAYVSVYRRLISKDKMSRI
jgi:glycosyltransferase involved in cell wall biosynthesis